MWTWSRSFLTAGYRFVYCCVSNTQHSFLHPINSHSINKTMRNALYFLSVFQGNHKADEKNSSCRNMIANKCRRNDRIRQLPSCNPYCKNGFFQWLKVDTKIIRKWLMENLQWKDHVDISCPPWSIIRYLKRRWWNSMCLVIME